MSLKEEYESRMAQIETQEKLNSEKAKICSRLSWFNYDRLCYSHYRDGVYKPVDIDSKTDVICRFYDYSCCTPHNLYGEFLQEAASLIDDQVWLDPYRLFTIDDLSTNLPFSNVFPGISALRPFKMKWGDESIHVVFFHILEESPKGKTTIKSANKQLSALSQSINHYVWNMQQYVELNVNFSHIILFKDGTYCFFNEPMSKGLSEFKDDLINAIVRLNTAKPIMHAHSPGGSSGGAFYYRWWG